MSNFRNTADLVDAILRRSGEPTNGNSAFEEDALLYANHIHQTIISGGSEFNVDVDIPWTWARAEEPIHIELQPKYEDGTISLTEGSSNGVFSSAPAISLLGYHIRPGKRDSIFKIVSHSAGQTAFALDAAYDGDTDATLEYRAFKLDYELTPRLIVRSGENDRIDFEETDGTEITATIPAGSYTASALASAVATALDLAGASTYTVSYTERTGLFTLLSDGGGGGGIFELLGASGTNATRSLLPTLGFAPEDLASALTYTSGTELGAVSRLIEPARLYKDRYQEGQVFGMDPLTFSEDYPLPLVREGYPTRFTKIREDARGRITVRFNNYPREKTKVDFDYIPVPLDLKDNTASVPLIPRKFARLLEFGAAYYIMLDKEDSKGNTFLQLANQLLLAMKKQNQNELQRVGTDFGETVPRSDLDPKYSRRLNYGYTADGNY